MKKFFCLWVVCLILFSSGCSTTKPTVTAPAPEEKESAGAESAVEVSVPLHHSKSILIVIPKQKEVDAKIFTSLKFPKRVWGVSYAYGRIARQEMIRTYHHQEGSFDVERETVRQKSTSGIVYTVSYLVENNDRDMTLEFKPVKCKTYRQGPADRLPIPKFSEEDLFNYLGINYIVYTLEINSRNSPDALWANFERLASKASLKKGEKDPVTGKILKNRFSIEYRGNPIYFSLEASPYIGGSKAVVSVNIPGYFTSSDKVDFSLMINEIKSKLEAIVNS